MSSMPEFAKTVSGRTYVFDVNRLDFVRFRLTFHEERVRFLFSFRDKTVDVGVGTDGSPRMTECEGYVRAYRGYWSTDNTFAMRYQIMGTDEDGGIEITFEEDIATVLFFERVSKIREVLISRWNRQRR